MMFVADAILQEMVTAVVKKLIEWMDIWDNIVG